MPVDEINDPVGYWGGWLAVGIGLLVLAVALVAVTLWVTRTRKAPAPPAPRRLAPGEDPYAELRAVALRRIDDLSARHAAGQIDDRTLHHGLSAATREFACGRLGIDISALTLAEISRRRDAEPLTNLIAQYYRPSFADAAELQLRPGIDPAQSVQLARTAVSTW